MEATKTDSSETLRKYVGIADACELMAATFAYPTPELAEALVDGSYASDCTGCLSDIGLDESEVSDVADMLAAFRDRDASELLETLRKGNSILYLAPGLKVPVWPYESPFFTTRMDPNVKPSLFRTQIALDIEALMREAGVEFENGRTEPQDSIWNEFSYLSYLYGSLAQALLGDGEKDVASWQHHIDVFVDKHVLNWFDDFMAKSIECAPDHSFGIEYATFARIGSLVTKEIVTESRTRAR